MLGLQACHHAQLEREKRFRDKMGFWLAAALLSLRHSNVLLMYNLPCGKSTNQLRLKVFGNPCSLVLQVLLTLQPMTKAGLLEYSPVQMYILQAMFQFTHDSSISQYICSVRHRLNSAHQSHVQKGEDQFCLSELQNHFYKQKKTKNLFRDWTQATGDGQLTQVLESLPFALFSDFVVSKR